MTTQTFIKVEAFDAVAIAIVSTNPQTGETTSRPQIFTRAEVLKQKENAIRILAKWNEALSVLGEAPEVQPEA